MRAAVSSHSDTATLPKGRAEMASDTAIFMALLTAVTRTPRSLRLGRPRFEPRFEPRWSSGAGISTSARPAMAAATGGEEGKGEMREKEKI